MNSYHTYTEIKSQPQAWQNALDVTSTLAANIQELTDRYDRVIFSGCGSTYYLSLAGAALYQQLTGKPARAVPGSELLFNSSTVLEKDAPTLLVAISRSGTTSETLRAVEHFKRSQKGEVIAISNYDTDLAALADLSILLPAGQEESVAQTRSFASMYVAVTALSAAAARRNDLSGAISALPEVGQRLMAKYEDLAKALGEDLSRDRFYFLGSGSRYGLACEGNLKMKEMTLTHSEPFHFL
jgi:glucosamine--fructose-6-phosphate aminotransferase (isomerizing)